MTESGSLIYVKKVNNMKKKIVSLLFQCLKISVHASSEEIRSKT